MKINDFFNEEKVRLDPKCWTGKKIGNPKTKVKGGVRVNNCVPAESVEEAANPAQQAAIAIAKKKKAGVEESAPPGAKAERMVKHIKKGYAKDGKLSDKEKSIAYATAWKAHNKGVTESGMPFRGVGGAFNRGDDERHDLDPTDWYFVKDGKMFKVAVYPNQEQEAIARGYSRTRAEAKAKAGQQGVAEGFKNMYAEFSGYGNYMQGRAINVFNKAGLEIVSKDYTEDDDIQTYVVKGDRQAIEKAGEFLERNAEQFGGYHFVKSGVSENYPKHQDLSGVSTDKLKAYLAKQSKQSVPGEGGQVKRVQAELQRRQQGVAEGEAPLKHHTARVSYHKEGDPHRRYEAIFKTTHNGGKEETEKRAKAAFAAKKKIVYDIVHEQGVAEGSVEKTATGLKHRGDFPDYPSRKGQQFQSDPDRLNKSETGRLDKAFGVDWIAKNKRKEISGDPTGVSEEYNPEYDDEAGMADNNLETLDRTVAGIDDLIDSGDNLPEWCQEKIAVAKSMLVSVWDYMYSEEQSSEGPEIAEGDVKPFVIPADQQQGNYENMGYRKNPQDRFAVIDYTFNKLILTTNDIKQAKQEAIEWAEYDDIPVAVKNQQTNKVVFKLNGYADAEKYLEESVDREIVEMYEALQHLVTEMAANTNASEDTVWETFEAMDDNILYETAAWRRKEGKSAKGGLNAKGVASYRRENPGSKLQTAVTTKPSKLKPGSKAAKRRKSFCARMGGVKGPMKKPNGKPTRKALALRKWNC